MQRATKYGALALALAAVVAAGVVGTLLTRQNLQSSRGHPDAYTVAVGISGCGTGWSHATSGTQTFDVKNTSIAGMEVYLQSAEGGKVYLDLESLGAGSTTRGTAVLAAGR